MNRLRDFLFAPIPPHLYAWLRIGVGLCACLTMALYADRLGLLYSDDGVLPHGSLAYQPPHGANLLDWATTPTAVVACYWVTMVLGFAYTAGLLTVLTGPLLWYCLLSFINRNTYAAFGGQLLVVDMLFVLLFAPTGRVLSVDAWLHARRHGRVDPAATIPLVLRLLQVQLVLLYLKSGFYKLMGLAWVQGDALQYVMKNPLDRYFDVSWVFSYPWVVTAARLATWSVLAWEVLFPLLILWRPTRRVAVTLGILNHGLILFTVPAGTYSLAVFVAYLCLLDPGTVERISLSKARAKTPVP